MVLYAWSLQWCWETSGDPYRAAIAHATAKSNLGKVNSGYAEAVVDLDDEDEDEGGNGSVVPSVGDVVQAVGSAAAKVASAINETAVLERMKAQERKMPNPLLPDFWAVLTLFAIIIANALVWFVQRWSLYIKSVVQYKAGPCLEAGCFAYVTPHPHQGAAEILPVQEKVIEGRKHMFFVYQRQKYQVSDDGMAASDLEMPVGKPMSEYMKHRGYESAQKANSGLEMFGKNSLQIELPSFMVTFKKQVLGPVPVFQFFCASLWLLDEYWNYALFNIFAICMYEASTAFGKLKNLQALRGMKNEAVMIYVYRSSTWQVMTHDS